MTKPPKRSPSKHTPRAYLAAIFETVIEEAEQNPEFMERLAARLDGEVTVVVAGRARKGPAAVPEALRGMDLPAEREALGQIGLREKLSGFTNAELAALVRERKLSTTPASKMNKGQLVNAIMRASKG